MSRRSWPPSTRCSGNRRLHFRKARVDHFGAHPGAGGRFERGGRTILNFASNDYLDLARHPRVTAAAESALRESGTGAAASRLMSGTLELHERLERGLARFKRTPAALLGGYV